MTSPPACIRSLYELHTANITSFNDPTPSSWLLFTTVDKVHDDKVPQRREDHGGEEMEGDAL